MAETEQGDSEPSKEQEHMLLVFVAQESCNAENSEPDYEELQSGSCC